MYFLAWCQNVKTMHKTVCVHRVILHIQFKHSASKLIWHGLRCHRAPKCSNQSPCTRISVSDKKDFPAMAKKMVGLIWKVQDQSPLSSTFFRSILCASFRIFPWSTVFMSTNTRGYWVWDLLSRATVTCFSMWSTLYCLAQFLRWCWGSLIRPTTKSVFSH